jgi:hypothetical protein
MMLTQDHVDKVAADSPLSLRERVRVRESIKNSFFPFNYPLILAFSLREKEFLSI